MSTHLKIFTLLCSTLLIAGAAFASEAFNPHRVLLVIGDQWQDGQSFLVDITVVDAPEYDHTVRPQGVDFMQLVVMLKSWGVPFDIVRLDQESLDINHFLGPDSKPAYGCILWAADPEARLLRQDYAVLKDAVESYGISLVALSNRIRHPVLEQLLGLRYKGYFMSSDQTSTKGDHYLTRGLQPEVMDLSGIGYIHRVQVEAGEGVRVMAYQGKYPLVTGRRIRDTVRAMWIGGDAAIMFDQPKIRAILRRAITCSIGYSIFKTWENKCVIVMDDPGGAQCAYLEHWQYPTLTRDQISTRLIEPLRQHNAKMVINVVPGFVNDSKRWIELSFQQDFTDEFGVRQNFKSTKLGLEDGVSAGVFEIQCHGWTHMQPDLDSPPGPWWGAPLDGEKAEVGWYREFGDTRRGFVDIPAATQVFRMKTGIKWLKYLFDIDPLSFVSGGGGVSLSYANHTWILAARQGFGWFCWFGGYLGPDMAVRNWLYEGSPESPRTIPVLPDAHDKGIAEHPEQFAKTFDMAGPDAEFIGLNEFIGYMHAGRQAETPVGCGVVFNYDPHYCQHFKTNQSSWKLDVADWARQNLAGGNIVVDSRDIGKVTSSGLQEIEIPAGTGKHTVEIR